MSIIDEKKDQFDKAITHLKNEFDNIRTGRANPSLVENLSVDYYGNKTPLNQLSTITAPDAQSIVIQPWDKNAFQDIEKAISSSSLGLNPVNEGTVIRLPIPPLTEESRMELSKVANHKVENAKIAIRNIREEIWKIIKEQKTSSEISEDDMYRLQKELQDIVDEFNEKIISAGKEKSEEIMSI